MTTLKQIEEKAMHAVRYGDELRPQRDWSVLLILAGLILIASITVSAWTFIRVTQGQPVGVDGSAAGNAASDIENAKALFEERRAEEARYRSEYQFVDPS
ncbi:MAG: hypothetical protein KBC38_02020 [Candidatus Pacebacteria bacterium]|nr:hypothetical protein [Candidatus Paceibacterota bacterium]MBP9840066.1 hypothetical protein [Candidatus Paceibacterota bacterium]